MHTTHEFDLEKKTKNNACFRSILDGTSRKNASPSKHYPRVSSLLWTAFLVAVGFFNTNVSRSLVSVRTTSIKHQYYIPAFNTDN